MLKKEIYYIKDPEPQYKESWLKMWPDYVREFIPRTEALELTWERLLDKGPELYGLFLFSKKDDEFIGFLHYVMHRTTWFEGYDCYIDDAYIKQEHRNKGAFTFLYEELAKRMKVREDCRFIHWITRDNNYPARAAYDKVAKRTDWVRYEHRLIDTDIKIKEQK